MSWGGGFDAGGGAEWKPDTAASEPLKAEDTGGGGDAWGGAGVGAEAAGSAFGGAAFGGDNAADDGDSTCRFCKQEGHFARDCPDKPKNSGLCYNCGQTGHNKADCTNPTVERPYDGICKLCNQEGHKALNCKSRRTVDWAGIPEVDAAEAWTLLVDAAKAKDLDKFRIGLKAYARALNDDFKLQDVETALRTDQLPFYLIAKQQEVAINATIVDLIGNPEREYVLTFQLSDKPRRKKWAEGWPENAEDNLKRLASAGIVQDRGVPLCSNCGELGHIRKYCNQEVVEREKTAPVIKCVYCNEEGHRARDCPKERVDPFACKNCKQPGHNAKECTEPRSAENVECRKCNQMGHFSKDCPNVEARKCRNCGSADHIAKECDQPRNPENTVCRNCEKTGHFSRECREPKDWSKVKCTNCGEMGHTIKRCKVAVPDAGGDGLGDGGPVEPVAAAGNWETAAPEAAGAWNTGDDGGASVW